MILPLTVIYSGNGVLYWFFVFRRKERYRYSVEVVKGKAKAKAGESCCPLRVSRETQYDIAASGDLLRLFGMRMTHVKKIAVSGRRDGIATILAHGQTQVGCPRCDCAVLPVSA